MPVADVPYKQALRFKAFWRLAGIGANAVFGCGLYGWLSSRPQVTYHERAVGLGAHKRLRVAAVSDLHLEGDPKRYRWILDVLHADRPDVVAFVGDTVEEAAGLPLISLFSEIEPPLGKFATLGNWEYGGGVSLRELDDHYRRAGVRLLCNDAVDLGGLQLVGLDDWREGYSDSAVVYSAMEQGPTLALSHCPGHFDELAAGMDPALASRLLVVSGHTHGGQLAPFGLVLVLPPGSGPYVSGWYERGGAGLYVMRGVGYSGPRLRLGPRPELAVLDLV